jgi:ribosome-binding protein aMBF1 (putative translation factor)
MDFQRILSDLRRTRKLSQEQLAQAVGVHPNILGRYERGEAKPSIEIATKLADALEVSLDQLVGREKIQLDKEIAEKVLTIQRLPEKDRAAILHTLEAMIRDAKARAAYS